MRTLHPTRTFVHRQSSVCDGLDRVDDLDSPLSSSMSMAAWQYPSVGGGRILDGRIRVG